MRRGPTISVGLVALTCASLLSGTASAAVPQAAEEPTAPIGFELHGGHGYLISGYAYPAFGSEPAVIALTATRGRETVSYTAPARVSADSIRADLGSLGRVDLKFRPSGREKTVNIKCLHRPESFEAGIYEGVVELNGEHGYTDARADRLTALPALDLLAGSVCSQRGSGESRGPHEPGARLAGISYAHGRTLKFQFNKNRPGGKTLFSATLSERRDGIRIYRQLTGVAPASAFRYDANVRTATLRPPAPFSGSASLKRRRNSVSPLLTGDLTLAFPGRSVGLGGPSVHVSLVHARLTKGNGGSTSIGF